ncbi:MAG TPA: hypothetical protein VMT35_02265 [Ignavibacteriaceae bacterium]|nr:hypothetical protein [Ignavibacteriaceae bacterium]
MKVIKILLLINIFIILNYSDQYGQYLFKNVSLLGRIGDGRNSGMCIDNNKAFVGGGCYLYIFDITDNSNPKLLSKILTPSAIVSIKIFGEYALIANSAAGLSIINISDIKNRVFVSNYNTKSVARDNDIFNNYAFVSDVYYGFVVIDISNVFNPREIFAYESEGGEEIKIKDNYLFFCNNYHGLRIFDISNPASPVLKSTFTQCNSAETIEFYKNYAILSDQYYGIYILNLTNITDIKIISQLPITRMDRQLTLNGDSIYV